MASATKCELVADIEACQRAVAQLMQEDEVPIDIEGIRLSRKGEVCIIQMYAASTSTVYLFDVVELGQGAFEAGCLKRLLESERVMKIFFDVRSDNDALFHLHDISVRNAYDLQILYDAKFTVPSDLKLHGLKKAMAEFFEATRILSQQQIRELECLKERGHELFAPDKGGRYEVWKERPLSKLLLQYAAADVKFLLDMKRYWGVCKGDDDMTKELDKVVRDLSASRLERFLKLPETEAVDQEQKKFRDYPIPEGFNNSGQISKEVYVPRDKKGLVIGKRGANIKGIEASSGARVTFPDDQRNYVLVIGQPAQVKAAVRQISAKIN